MITTVGSAQLWKIGLSGCIYKTGKRVRAREWGSHVAAIVRGIVIRRQQKKNSAFSITTVQYIPSMVNTLCLMYKFTTVY
jgi:hypothetical protein